MDQVPFNPSVVAITGGTIVGVTISGAIILASTISGNTILSPTISGGTAIGITLTGSTILGGSISGATITAAGGALSGTTLNAPVGSGGTWVAGTFSGTTLIGPIISGGTAKTLTLTGTTLFSGPVVVSGNTITAPSGIIFSDETLNQYDEGTWTPTILGSTTAGTQTYSTQVGTYTRIGRLVTCVFNIGLSAYDAATNGNILIGGFPFTCSSLVGFSSGGAFGFASNVTLGAGYTQLSFRIATSATTATLAKFGTAVASGTITQADVGATLALRGTIKYEI